MVWLYKLLGRERIHVIGGIRRVLLMSRAIHVGAEGSVSRHVLVRSVK